MSTAYEARRQVALFEEARKIPAFVRRDFLVMWSYRLAFFSDWVNLGLQVILFYFIGQMVDPDKLPTFQGARINYIQFVAVGIAISAFLYIGLSRVVTVIRNEQMMGTLESLLTTPTSPMTLQLGSVMYDLLYVPIRTVIFLMLVSLLPGVQFTFAGLGPASGVLLVFIPVVWGLGMIAAGGVLTFRRGLGLVGLTTLFLAGTSSTYFPIELLPGPLRAIATFNPITIALGAMREALLGRAGWADVVPAILMLVPMAAVSLALGIAAFRLALRRELRRGTLGLY
jgi:ABC-2 type transport system permease protein